jgi:rare lipoprotein A
MRQYIFTFTTLVAFVFLSSFSIQVEEIGKAGYYADALQGRKTASGELYDKFEFTCAHKTLPFGTKIKVTRLDNNRSVVVRVNDRGPFIEGYIVDLSRAAAEEINLIKIGVTQVKVELVSAVSNRRAVAETNNSAQLLTQQSSTKSRSSAQYGSDLKPVGVKETADLGKTSNELFSVDMQMMRKTGFGVQVSTLYDSDNVLPTVKKLQQDWPNKVLVSLELDETYNKSTYRIILGPYFDNKTAAVQQKAAAKKGFKGCFIVDMGSM